MFYVLSRSFIFIFFYRRERVGESEAHRSPRDVTQPRLKNLSVGPPGSIRKAAHLQDVRRARAVQAPLPLFINGQLHIFFFASNRLYFLTQI